VAEALMGSILALPTVVIAIVVDDDCAWNYLRSWIDYSLDDNFLCN
jgi:hypothetical protein